MGNKTTKPNHPSHPQIEVPSTRRVNLKREVLLMRQMRHQQNCNNEIKPKDESKTELTPLLPEKGESISVIVPPRRPRRSSTINDIRSEPDFESMLGKGQIIGLNQNNKIQSTASAVCDNPNMVIINNKSSISKSNSRKSKVKSSIDLNQYRNKTTRTRTNSRVTQMLYDSNGNVLNDNRRKVSIGDGSLKNDENGNFYVNAPHTLMGGGRDSSIIVLKSNVKKAKRKDNQNKIKESKEDKALWDGDKKPDTFQQEDELLDYDPKTTSAVESKSKPKQQQKQSQPKKESSQAFQNSQAYGDSAKNSQGVRGGDSTSSSNELNSLSQYSSVSGGSESRSKKKKDMSNSNNGSLSKSRSQSISKSAAKSNRSSNLDFQSQSQSKGGGETSSYIVAKNESRGPARDKNNGEAAGGKGESSSRPYNNCRLRCCPPPCFISSGGCGGSSKKNCCDENPIERLNNVDIIEELCYYPPGDPCCAEYDYYTYNECGELEKICSPPQSTNPVKYCRKQRFNFKKNRNDDTCGDGPPFSWTGNCSTDACPTCCCSPRLFRRQSSFDELPVGRNPIACKPVPSCCDGGAGSTCSSSEDEDLIPCESGVYFYDAKEKKFIRQMVEENRSKNKKNREENEDDAEDSEDIESDPCPCPNPCPPAPRTPQPAYVCEEFLNEPINTIQQIVQPCVQPVAAQCCQIPIMCNPCQNPCCPPNPCCPQQNNCCNGNNNNNNGNNNNNNDNGNRSKRRRKENRSSAYYNESSYDYQKDKYNKRNKNGSGDPYYEDKDKKKNYSGDSDYTNSYSYYSTGDDGDYDNYSSSKNYSNNKNNQNNNQNQNNCCPPGCQPVVQQPAQTQNPGGCMGCMPIVMCGNLCNQKNNNPSPSYGYSGSYPYSDYYDYSDYGYSGSSYSYDYAYENEDESKKE